MQDPYIFFLNAWKRSLNLTRLKLKLKREKQIYYVV